MKIYQTSLAVLILGIFLSLELLAQDNRSDKNRLKITTFNARFLWDGVEPEEGRVDFAHKSDQTAAEEHMADISEILRKIDADIVNWVEVENIEALTTFNDKFLKGMGYMPFLVKGRDSFTGQDVCLLTKIAPNGPLERFDEKGRSGQTEKSVSKNYFAKFTLGDLNFAVIGIHLLARPSSEGRKDDKQAQADAIRSLATSLVDDGFEIVMLGDFNDFDAEVPDINRNFPITSVLVDLKAINGSTTSDDLFNVAEKLPMDRRFTAHWDKDRDDFVDRPDEFSSLDHILLSPTLAKMIGDVEVVQNFDFLSISDHFPLSVTLSLNGVEPSLSSAQIKMTSLLPNPVGNENEKSQRKTLSCQIL